jgi:hypothetical protein
MRFEKIGKVIAFATVFAVSSCGDKSESKGSGQATIPSDFKNTATEVNFGEKATTFNTMVTEVEGKVGVEDASSTNLLPFEMAAVSLAEDAEKSSGGVETEVDVSEVKENASCSKAFSKLNVGYSKTLKMMNAFFEKIKDGKVPDGMKKATPTDGRTAISYNGEASFGTMKVVHTFSAGASDKAVVVIYDTTTTIGELKMTVKYELYSDMSTKVIKLKQLGDIATGANKLNFTGTGNINGGDKPIAEETLEMSGKTEKNTVALKANVKVEKTAENTVVATGTFTNTIDSKVVTKSYNVTLVRGDDKKCKVKTAQIN